MKWTKYKCVVLIAIIAVTLGVAYTLDSFNKVVAPAIPVQAIHFENPEPDTYSLKILGEDMTVKKSDEYYRFIEDQWDKALALVNHHTAELRDKYFADFIQQEH